MALFYSDANGFVLSSYLGAAFTAARRHSESGTLAASGTALPRRRLLRPYEFAGRGQASNQNLRRKAANSFFSSAPWTEASV
jgi:hypothetical protein